MRILLVEDDLAKRNAITEYVKSIAPEAEVEQVTSFRGAVDAMKAHAPDTVILDMSIPSFEGASAAGRPQVYGGRDVLRQMRRLSIHARVVLVTQYPRFGEGPDSVSLAELDQQLSEVYPEYYVGAVAFSFVYDTWKDALRLHLRVQSDS